MTEKVLPREGVDFAYLETQDEETLARSVNPVVVILREDYKGVIAQYGNIGLVPDENPPKLKFDFAVLNPTDKFTPEQLNNNSEFKNLLGDIVISTIEDMANRVLQEDESRNNNS